MIFFGERYEYDGIYQLVSAEGRKHPDQQPSHADPPWLQVDPSNMQALKRYREQYKYDEVGNVLQTEHRTLASQSGSWTRRYDYATDSSRLLGTSVPGDQAGQFSAKCAYDSAGNIIAMMHLQRMKWDYANRLKATAQKVVNIGTPETTYLAYDATGERVRKVTDHYAPEGKMPTRKREHIYPGGFEVRRDYEGDGATVKLERETLHVMDDERRVALIDTKTKDASVSAVVLQAMPHQRYQISNHLGSSLMELDEAAQVITYEEYFPFGGTSFRVARAAAESSLKRYRYTGKERDEETGLYYLGARYYAPWLGRWTSADPAGFVDGSNRYRYVRNSPLVLNDPSGTEPEVNLQQVADREHTVARTDRQENKDDRDFWSRGGHDTSRGRADGIWWRTYSVGRSCGMGGRVLRRHVSWWWSGGDRYRRSSVGSLLLW